MLKITNTGKKHILLLCLIVGIAAVMISLYASAKAARPSSVEKQIEIESKSNPLPTRTPYTQKDVTPGDPASYEGTYGQCPFYENAAKGCTPPPDIQCNANWSKCEYIGTPAPEQEKAPVKETNTCNG